MEKETLILHLEDSVDDALLLRFGLDSAGYSGMLVLLDDGEKGQAYLLGDGEFSNRTQYPLPDLIVCDLKMPRVSGGGFLMWRNKLPQFLNIPVTILSASDMEGDIQMALETGAERYFVKPLTIDGWNNVARNILALLPARKTTSAV